MAPFLNGFFLFSYLFTVNRIISVKFPLDLLSVFFYCYALLGFSLGLFYTSNIKQLHVKIMYVLAPVFTACMLFNQNVTVHFLILNTYYPYPKPQGVVFYMTLLILFIALLPVVPFYLGAKAKLESPRALFIFFLGGAAATFFSHHVILLMGAPLFLSLALFLIFFERKPVAAALFLLCLSSLFFFKKNVFFLWRVRDYKTLSSHWTPHYKVDFISFNHDRCLGGVHNTLMIWYVCDSLPLLENEVRQSQQALVPYAHDVLNLGRVDGINALTLLEQGANIHSFTSADMDAFVENKVRAQYHKYNKEIFHRANMKSLSGDLRSIMKKTSKRYDLVYLDGIGIRLYTYPFSIIPYENYLYTKDSYDTLFMRVLKKDGVLIADWGSSNLEEVYPLVANLPHDAHFKVYWTTFTNYPMLGLPVFYVLAAKSMKRLNDISENLKLTANFKEIKIPPVSTLYHFNDSRPFVQRALYFILLFLSLPLAFLFAACWRFLKRNFAFQTPQVFYGIFFGLLLAYSLSRDTRYFYAGPATGFLCVNTAFFVFLFLGSLMPFSSWVKTASIPTFALFLFLHQHFNDERSLWLALPVSFLCGSLLSQKVRAPFSSFFFGLPLGIYLFQFILVLGGYWTAAVSVALLFAFLQGRMPSA